jgi:hypothetical protein
LRWRNGAQMTTGVLLEQERDVIVLLQTFQGCLHTLLEMIGTIDPSCHRP